jgi:quaternary ammonium compound-resistance protein SugE
MPWLILLLAGFFEIAWAIGLKYTEGFTRVAPTAITLALLAASVYLLSVALRSIPVGTGYAVWTGIGVVGTTILGILLFDEPRGFLRIASIALILLGLVGVRLSGATPGGGA